MRFLSHGPIVRVEHNEVRSVMETVSGLLSAMRVLSKSDRLSFVQAVPLFRRPRRVSLVATRHAGCETSCRPRRVILWQLLCLVPLVS